MNFKNIKIDENILDELYAIIEISKGSRVKYEYNEEFGTLFVDRILYTNMYYPLNYGFILGTLCEDGDPLDVLVLSSEVLLPGCIVKVRPVALLEMEDEKGRDEKLIAVPIDKVDPKYSWIRDVNDIPQAIKNEIKHFFEHYKDLEPGKWVKVKGWRDREYAIEFIRKVIKK